MIGIYKFENNITHQVYIGQSVDIEDRYRHHLSAAKREPNATKFYQNLNKYGIDNFTFSVVEQCAKEELDEKECYWIAYYDSYNNGYNSTIGGLTPQPRYKLNDTQIQNIYNELQADELSMKEIANKYNISIRTLYYINIGESYYNDTLIYPIRARKSWKIKNVDIKNSYQCIDCGKAISKITGYCFKCAMIHQQKEPPISREELKKLIRTMPFTQIGKQFNVTDNAIKKWCIKLNLPKTKKEINSYDNEKWEQI